jgi:Flp pilus assembly protein TadD
MAYEEMGRTDDAVRDYRSALAIEPALDRIPFNLSSLLEQKGKFCEARQPILQFVKYHPAFSDAPNVVDRLERLRILGHCPQ